MKTIKDIIDYASKKIGYIEANILMKYVLNVDKSYLIINSDKILAKEQINQFDSYLKKIEKGYPIQYITHKQEFMGLSFYVDERVLIPQPDTEVLVEEAIKILNKKTNNTKENNKKAEISPKIQILDLCTGSGAIAISISNYIKENDLVDYEIVASDISIDALAVAKKNYEKLNVAPVKFVESNMFKNIEGKFDIIVSNPPYIKKDEIRYLSKEVQNEPHIALDGGEDGLEFYKEIKDNLNKFLKEQGTLLLEIGYDQKKDLLKLFEGATCIKDLGGNDRVIIYQPLGTGLFG